MSLLIYCDGSSTERSGRAGGWAFILVRDGKQLATGTGGAARTTNNLMELEAAQQGLKAAREQRSQGETIELITDSRYVLEQLQPEPGVTTRWIRGHSGNEWNERADALAHEAKQAFIPSKVKRRQAKKRKNGDRLLFR